MAVLTEPRVHQWTRGEYYAMAAAGLFAGKYVELIEGQAIETSSMGSPHRTAVILAGNALRRAFAPGYFVQTQGPLDLGELSDPEPDVAVIAGIVRDYTEAHPTTATLVGEIADTSLTYDRTTKASLYAKAGIADYWIVNLVQRQLEVHRSPVTNPAAPFGFSYATVTIYAAAEGATSVAAAPAMIAVAELLP
jgi:Uma2 family endonuclease